MAASNAATMPSCGTSFTETTPALSMNGESLCALAPASYSRTDLVRHCADTALSAMRSDARARRRHQHVGRCHEERLLLVVDPQLQQAAPVPRLAQQPDNLGQPGSTLNELPRVRQTLRATHPVRICRGIHPQPLRAHGPRAVVQ